MKISNENIENFVYYEKITYHKNCFEKLKAKYLSKLNKYELEKIYEDSTAHFKSVLISNEVYEFMLDNYDLTVINNKVFQKLQNIYTGSIKGMSVGIPIEDLLNMWQRKIKYLNKIHNQNITKGKQIDGNNRILYDLSVLVNKYDSYLQWKREQQILQATSNIDKAKNDNVKINFNIIEKQVKSQSNSQSNDLNSLLDEMF